ncbi:MAG: DNA translocase FtsK 4TM domain-containing protein [Anaerolineae bacterium]|nr:DNA translocase FtsK 4TM domain-containing protein [Anaerolineae bacterium]
MARTANRSRTPSNGKSKSQGLPSLPKLSLDAWLDIVGIALVVLAVVTLLSLVSAQRTRLLEGWLGVMRLVFGWGVYAAPLLMGAGGLYLVIRRFGDRIPIPTRLSWRLGSALLAYGLGLGLVHLAAALLQRRDVRAVADEAQGGGLLGWLVVEGLRSVIGELGAALVMLLGIVIASMLVAQRTPLQLVEGMRTQLARLRERRALSTSAAHPIAASDLGAVMREDDLVINDARTRRLRTRPLLSDNPPLRIIGEAPAPLSSPAAATARSASGQFNRVPPPRPIGASSPSPRANVADVAGPTGALAQSSASQAEIRSRVHVQRTWQLPDISALLEPGSDAAAEEANIRQMAAKIEETLRAFGAPGRVVEVNRGPTITQFGVEPGFVEMKGGRQVKVKVSRIAALADDLALALAAPRVRIEAPVPGRGIVGIEVPNAEAALVALRDVMESEAFEALRRKTPLPLALGQDVSGNPVVADLTAMPHLLIAGTTGSGKSVCVNSIITTLLCLHTPDDLRLLMIDPKRVELIGYNGIPHLIAPVVVEVDKCTDVLKWATREMESRYRLFARHGARNIADFNAKASAAQRQPNPDPDLRRLPYIVLIIDELADLMMVAPDETEKLICRLAQMARATGIHLIIATQRPSVDVVTGLIKANFPARIAFAVATSVDSRVILDAPGAEKLLGRGDMLFLRPDYAAPLRAQGVFVRDDEIRRVVDFWRAQASETGLNREAPTFSHASAGDLPPTTSAPPPTWDEARALRNAFEGTPEAEVSNKDDKLFNDAVAVVRTHGKASISLLQRRLRIGYTRAARLIEEMEARGIVGPAVPGQQYREVLPPAGK